MAKEEKEEVVYTKSTAQLDLESRLENENATEPTVPQLVNPATPDEDKDLYVGTDPIYQNHANDTEAPKQAEEGGDELAEKKFLKSYEKPEVNLKRREALEKGDDQEVLDKPLTDEVTPRGSALFAADPGTGEGSAETNEGPDEDNEKASASPTSSGSPQGTNPPAPQEEKKATKSSSKDK